MEAVRQIVRIPEDREIKIKVPIHIPVNETAEIILLVRKNSDDFEDKISRLKEAANDTLFIDDLKDISRSFETADMEGWE